ncbi:MAG: gluconate 2-dehydrogenase subunit 3 family protein [Vicinamibacterales bacterium]
MIDLHNRRAFLRAVAASGVAWVAADIVEVEDALAYAGQQVAGGRPNFSALTRPQAEALDAMTGRIIPSVDGRPGAREAGAVYFIDRALATFNAAQKAMYVDGVADLNRRAASRAPGNPGFAALSSAQQDEVLREVERAPFFQAMRFDTIVGTFALPTWGGNRDHLGWQMIGFEHLPRFQAPFGFYDADANRRG